MIIRGVSYVCRGKASSRPTSMIGIVCRTTPNPKAHQKRRRQQRRRQRRRQAHLTRDGPRVHPHPITSHHIPSHPITSQASGTATCAEDGRTDRATASQPASQTKPNQTKPNQTKPNQTKPNQTKPNQTKPEHAPPPSAPQQVECRAGARSLAPEKLIRLL
ncbi:hypothetical protein BZA05DRAFT_201401 [Tricharina praecox]|uniref:uncharacterized protein n=1 Tax=Tricharina praecox TaxID=43433 RepID=UPI00221ECEAC|nr:uncharacterized protein BZA05DRAFT_201401 [Tricharina praecox]KAI5856459.1 hypothetical protein BZA05DRAFT_201401 [Tricharina praecox]